MQQAAINDAINDNTLEVPTPGRDKATALARLKTTLAQLDPAQAGPALLEAVPQAGMDERRGATLFEPGWLHELWAPRPSDHAAATAWALSAAPGADKTDRPILWVTNRLILREQGLPYGPGLAALGLDPARLILVRTADHPSSLWALEEGIKSGAFAAIVGEVGGIDLASSRRLSLAAQAQDGLCLLIVRSETEPQSAAYSRWRVAADASPPTAFDAKAPGPARLAAGLCKHRGGGRPHRTSLEWQDATDRFHMVAPLADRAPVSTTGQMAAPAAEAGAASA